MIFFRIWELSEHQFILACTILAIGIFILVCIFGILICLSEMNEFKGIGRKFELIININANIKRTISYSEHKMSIVSPAEIYKMTKLEEVKEEPTKASPSAQSEG